MQFMAIVFNIQLHTYGPETRMLQKKSYRPVKRQREIASICLAVKSQWGFIKRGFFYFVTGALTKKKRALLDT